MVNLSTKNESKKGYHFGNKKRQIDNLLVLPEKLRLLTQNKSFREISRKNEISQPMVTYVIKGQKTSKRVASILETEYKLTLTEIQELIYEHINRQESGNPITDKEVYEWYQWYRAERVLGISVDELREREAERDKAMGLAVGDFGKEYYRLKRKREAYYKKVGSIHNRSMTDCTHQPKTIRSKNNETV